MNQVEIINFCNELLSIDDFKDYCPNGLQVEGDNRQVKRIATGVSISLELIGKAIEANADLIITHHGMIWDKAERIIRGPMKQKLSVLFDSGIAAAAYHLPLDFHPEIGNNVQLAGRIGLQDLQPFAHTGKYSQGIMGNTTLKSIDALAAHVSTVLEREPQVLPYGPDVIKKVAIVTGGAQSYFQDAIEAGADCFLTGEISEQNYTMSREYGVHFISAGHYSTELFGVQSLGERLESSCQLETCFIHIPNPI